MSDNAVAEILDSAEATALAVQPFKSYAPDSTGNKPRRGRPARDDSELSQTAAAKRARRRRAEQKGRPAPKSPDRVMTPASMLAETGTAYTTSAETTAPLPSGPPLAVVPAPDARKAIEKSVASLVKVLGSLAAVVTKVKRMRVPQDEANEFATLAVDAWPDIAAGFGGDAAKALAIGYGLSLVIERVGFYREDHPLERTDELTA